MALLKAYDDGKGHVDLNAYHALYGWDVHKVDDQILVYVAVYKDQVQRNMQPKGFLEIKQYSFTTKDYSSLSVWGPQFFTYLKTLAFYSGATDV